MDIEKFIKKIELNSNFELKPSNEFYLFDKNIDNKITEKGRVELSKVINNSKFFF